MCVQPRAEMLYLGKGQARKLKYIIKSSIPSIFHDFLTPVSNIYSYNTRYATENNFYRPQIRTNIGKFTLKYSASKIWESIPFNLKQLSTKNFKNQYKIHLLHYQT